MTVRGAIANGAASGDYTKEFTITVNAASTPPAITGPTRMTLTVGYGATSTGEYTITGTAPVTVTKTSGNSAITWNNVTMKLDITAGLSAGTYQVALTASNGTNPNATLTFTLTVQFGGNDGDGSTGGGGSTPHPQRQKTSPR